MATSREPNEHRRLRIVPPHEGREPAPLPRPVRPLWLWFGVAGGPIAWAINRLLSIYLVSVSCHGSSARAGSWSSAQTVELVITIVTAFVALAAGLTSWWVWRQTAIPETRATRGITASTRQAPFWALGGMFLSLFSLAAIVVTGGTAIVLGGTCH